MMYSKERWYKLVEEFEKKEAKLLHSKNEEYTGGEGEIDFLRNFREVAMFEGRSPAETGLTWCLKHVHGICKAIESGNYKWVWEDESGEQLKQRISDARNYLLLIAACLDDEQEKKVEHGPTQADNDRTFFERFFNDLHLDSTGVDML